MGQWWPESASTCNVGESVSEKPTDCPKNQLICGYTCDFNWRYLYCEHVHAQFELNFITRKKDISNNVLLTQ